MKTITALFIAIIILFGSSNILAQRPTTAVYKPTVEKLEIIDSANDFGEKGLPEPTIIGPNPSDELAAKLAKQISVYDENSLPILIATLQKAGFYIIDENQKILYKPVYGKGMGLAFYDFEVAGMLKLSRRGIVTSVKKFAGLIDKDIPAFPRNKLAETMLEDLKIAANSKNETTRFWARLIVELGKNSPQPVDLLTATPDNSQINIIQASILERRLIGDLIVYASKQTAFDYPNSNRQNLDTLFRKRENNVRFVNASFGSFLSEPCDFAQVETVQVDVAATALTTNFSTTLDLVAKYGKVEALEKIGAGIGAANLVLSWAKLIAALSQIKGEIKVEEPLPLIRTKSKFDDGEKRLLTGKFEIKMNKLRNINCYRLALNAATGLDFSMPSSGAMSEKNVSWDLGGEVSFSGQNSSQTGKFERIVQLYGTSPTRDVLRQETDAGGESKIYIEGVKQKEDLTRQAVVPLPRNAKVKAEISLKNMKDSKQEMADLGGFAFGLLMGGGPSPLAILSALPEVGFRMKLYGTSVKVPIRDWQPCSEDFGGIINVKRIYEKTTVLASEKSANGNNSGSGKRTIRQYDEADITLNPRTAEEVAAKMPKKPADIFARGEHTDITERLTDETNPCCGENEGTFISRFKYGYEEKYSNFRKQEFELYSDVTERDFSLWFNGSLTSETDKRTFREVDSNCELDSDEAKSKDSKGSITFAPLLRKGRYGQRAADEGGEIFWGTKVFNEGDGTITTWKWELARCKK